MQASPSKNIVIAGGGQAAAQAVMSLRQWGHEGAITLIGDESVPPYQRPPLSKAYMRGDFVEKRLFFRHAAWYQDHGVNLVLSTRVAGIDRQARQLHIEPGGHVDYDALIIATGSRPRRLPVPGAELAGVFDLRSLADADRIRPLLVEGRRMVIVGAGYIGLEVAATARHMGLEVTVLELAPRVLARVTSAPVSAFYEKTHRDHGVDIRTGARLASLTGTQGSVSGARLADGTEVPADLVLVGIGIVPNEELAAESGLECDDGIVVDRDTRTSDPRIYAAGDCSRRPLVHYQRSGRLESVHNAIEQGKLAAAAILGRPRPPEDCPWFWSDQYDLKLQTAGVSTGHDETVVRGDPADSRFAVFYLKGDTLIAVDAVNSPQEFMASKKLVMAGARPDRAMLADPSVSMKDVA